MAVSTPMSPMEATALATGRWLRSGRKTSRYASAPSTAWMASVTSNAGQKPQLEPTLIVGPRPGIGTSSCPFRRSE